MTQSINQLLIKVIPIPWIKRYCKLCLAWLLLFMCVSTVFAEKAIAVYGGGKIADVSKPFESFYYVINQNPDSVCQELSNTPARKLYDLNFLYKFDHMYSCPSSSHYGLLTVHYYCPSRHKIPTNSEEYINFPMADNNYTIYYNSEIDKNGDCIEVCPAPVNGQRAAADCTQTVSLTPAPGQAEPRPKGSEGGDGKSTYDLIAKVTEGNQPKAGMALTFKVRVEAGSGNHPLNPPDRPTGELSVKSSTTNASGEVKVTFTSPIFSGRHTVIVTCDKCTGTIKTAEKVFTVKVPNLIKTPTNINWRFISSDNYHKNNNASTATQTVYYLTQPAYTGLIQLTKYMVNNGWKTNSEKPTSVGLNDASLEWGGKFYSYKSGTNYIDWTSNDRAHKEHRIGVQIDLRTTDVSNELEKQMYQKICNPQDGKYPVQAKLLWHTGVQKCKNAKGVLVSCTPEHYHAYLLGDIDKKLGGGRCSSTPN